MEYCQDFLIDNQEKAYKIEIPKYASLSSGTNHSPFLDQPLVIVTIDTDLENLFSVTRLTDERISTGSHSNIIKFHSLQGNILDSFGTKSGNRQRDITCSKNRHLVYVNFFDRTFNIEKNKLVLVRR